MNKFAFISVAYYYAPNYVPPTRRKSLLHDSETKASRLPTEKSIENDLCQLQIFNHPKNAMRKTNMFYVKRSSGNYAKVWKEKRDSCYNFFISFWSMLGIMVEQECTSCSSRFKMSSDGILNERQSYSRTDTQGGIKI